MKIFLAPMEGVVDSYMRHILTRQGGFDACVTEFIRVVDKLLPERVFHRLCPELAHGGRTAAGTPVIIQLLGGLPSVVAENAARAAELGAPGIDINFGCPSRFVNRKAGGAVLLKEPERIHQIVSATRRAVPAAIPVSAKIRLGYDHPDSALEIAQAAQAGGAAYLVVHARTKADGYKAPVRWEWLARIDETLTIPVVANGDIDSVEAYRRCRQISGCEDVMIGRGAVGRPDLARQLRAVDEGQACSPSAWSEVAPLLRQMAEAMGPNVGEAQILGRLKQWLVMLKRHFSEARACFEEARRLASLEEFFTILDRA